MKSFLLLILASVVHTSIAAETTKIIHHSGNPYHVLRANSSRVLMPRLRAGNSATIIKEDEQGIIYKYRYNVDDYGMRLGQVERKDSQRHLIYAGCSFVFGDGVNDEETAPAQLSKILNDWQVYNLGISAGGPKELLWYLKNIKIEEKIKREEGIFLFNLFYGHFDRISGDIRNLLWASADVPDWEVDDKGSFKLEGFYSDRLDWNIVQFFNRSGLSDTITSFAYRFAHFTLRNTDELMLKYLIEMKKEYLKIFPKGRFVVTKTPLTPWLPAPIQEKTDNFLSKLKALNFEVWDNSVADPDFQKELSGNDLMIARDGHPSPKLNSITAKIIAKKITELKK